MEWLNAVLQGVLLGGLYALLAAGLSLMFGVMRIVNLAHGALAVLAAYALTLVAVGAVVLLVVVHGASAAASRIARPGFRRGIDGGTGVVMLGFATALAAES